MANVSQSFDSQCVTVNSGLVKSIRVPYVSAENIYADKNLYAKTINNISVDGFVATINNNNEKLDASTAEAAPLTLALRDNAANCAFNGVKVESIELSSGDFTATLRGSAATSANFALTLPPNAGRNGQILSTDGHGGTSWISAGRRVIINILSIAIVPGTGNYIIRLDTPVVLSGTSGEFSVTPGNSITSDKLRCGATVTSLRVYMSLSFSTSPGLRSVILQVAPENSIGGIRKAIHSIPANQSGYSVNLSAETGGIAANSDTLVTILWGSTATVTLLDGYIVAEC
jgi:hypothetical protein